MRILMRAASAESVSTGTKAMAKARAIRLLVASRAAARMHMILVHYSSTIDGDRDNASGARLILC
jgi:hypothetical protein